MTDTPAPDRFSILNDYAQGRLGTRAAIAQLGLRDYSDLLIALGQYDLRQPKPVMTPALIAHDIQAAAILMPRLQHHGD